MNTFSQQRSCLESTSAFKAGDLVKITLRQSSNFYTVILTMDAQRRVNTNVISGVGFYLAEESELLIFEMHHFNKDLFCIELISEFRSCVV